MSTGTDARRAALEKRKPAHEQFWNPIPGYIIMAASFGFFATSSAVTRSFSP